MKLYVIKGEKAIDITEVSGSINLSTSVDTLGASLVFNIVRNYNDLSYIFSDEIETGDVIILTNEKELFKGIVVSISTTKYSRTVECLDYCFYLNKNKVIKQFDHIAASVAIKQLLQEINAPEGEISNISTSITKVYYSNTIAEIINDILKQVNEELGVKYKLEFIDNKFNVNPFKKINVEFRYKQTGNETINESIQDMKNRILVTSNEQESTEILAIAEDTKNIEKYGSLQEIINVDPEQKEAKVRNIAKTKLKELNKVFKTVSLEGFGDDNFRAGRVVYLNNSKLKLFGEFLIKSCVHTWRKGEHIVNLEVELFEE
ncbi:hypothetical protein [uncultured Fusobacterium sp.]|uniref:XkdQ/YqbQ family protein n=1 Tax=uncultured Fusobacterium sp. TaxID=159267 RepID=UPI0025EE8184|nr:hypothetical protein [uncultured Fusobacterium sp.]